MRNLGPLASWIVPSKEMDDMAPRPREVENWEMKIWPATGPWVGMLLPTTYYAVGCVNGTFETVRSDSLAGLTVTSNPFMNATSRQKYGQGTQAAGNPT